MPRQYQGVHPNHNDGIQFSRDAKAAAVAELMQETGQGGQFAGLTQNYIAANLIVSPYQSGKDDANAGRVI